MAESETRRSFLRWVTAGAAGLWSAVVGIPAIRAVVWPATRAVRTRTVWVDLGAPDTFGERAPTRVSVTKPENDAWIESTALEDVWVYTDDGRHFRVYNGRCTHLGCQYDFDAEKDVFHCPCHGGVYDVKTGAVLAGPPPRPLDTLQTQIQDGVLSAAYEDFRVGIPRKIPVD